MKNTLVFGASLKPVRVSNLTVSRLLESGIETQAFGMASGEISGIPVVNSIADLEPADTITLYMNPKRQEPFYDTILGLEPKRVIFNPGTENPEFYSLLRKNDIQVEEACTLTLLATGQY